MLLPLIIFWGKTDQTIRNFNNSSSFIAKTQEKAWMDEDLMKVWVKVILLKHTLAECQRLEFQN